MNAKSSWLARALPGKFRDFPAAPLTPIPLCARSLRDPPSSTSQRCHLVDSALHVAENIILYRMKNKNVVFPIIDAVPVASQSEEVCIITSFQVNSKSILAVSTSCERRCLPLTAHPLYRPRQMHSSLVGCWGLQFLVISRHTPVTDLQINGSWKTVCVLAISLAHQFSDHKLRFSHLKENKLWSFDHKLHKGNIHSLAYSRPLCLLSCQFQSRLHNSHLAGQAPPN